MNRMLATAFLAISIAAPAAAQQAPVAPPAAASPTASPPAATPQEPSKVKPVRKAPLDRKALLRKRVIETRADLNALTVQRTRLRSALAAANKSRRKNTAIALRGALQTMNKQHVKARADYLEARKLSNAAAREKKPAKPLAQKPA